MVTAGITWLHIFGECVGWSEPSTFFKFRRIAFVLVWQIWRPGNCFKDISGGFLLASDTVFLWLNEFPRRPSFSRLLEAFVPSDLVREGFVDSRVSPWCSLTSDHRSLLPAPRVDICHLLPAHLQAFLYTYYVLWDWLFTFATVRISFWRIYSICSQTRLDPLVLRRMSVKGRIFPAFRWGCFGICILHQENIPVLRLKFYLHIWPVCVAAKPNFSLLK